MWAAIAKRGHEREDKWSTPFDNLPLELVVIIATITRDPSVYYGLVTTYKPLALFAKERKYEMMSAMTKNITGTFPMHPRVEETRGGVRYVTLSYFDHCSQEHPIEKLSLRKAERMHCVRTLGDRLDFGLEDESLINSMLVIITKTRYDILPNNVVEDYLDVRLAISIRFKVYLSEYQCKMGNVPIMEGVLAEVWKQHRNVVKSVFYDINGKICKTFTK
tara:strand:+ start:3680 stop:4336 length:657 start_codon:yes stop_codon:yes gene_type:complete